jgi:hypothetical protein
MPRRRYRFAGLVLDAAAPLPELPATRDAAPTCTVDFGPPGPANLDTRGGQAVRVTIRESDAGREHLIDFSGTASFAVSVEGTRVVCTPTADAPATKVRHLLLDQVLPRVLSLRGALVLHASVLVAPDGRGVAFLGPSGAGKSTLAASLVAAGWTLFSDDALIVETADGGPTAIPTYPGLRLWPDAAAWFSAGAEQRPVSDGSHKVRVDFGRGAVGGRSPARAPLGRVYLLDHESEAASPIAERLPAGEALRRAFEGEFRFTPADGPSLQASFDRIATSGVLPLCRRLSYSRGLAALPALHAEIVRDLGAA